MKPAADEKQAPETPTTGDRGTETPAEVREEEAVLARVEESLRARIGAAQSPDKRDYDAELIALRDQLAEARLEDAPPLIAQMERLQAVAARRQEVVGITIDVRSPYFAHLRLRENGRTRDVCIGRGTYLDAERGVRVVDWRNAPVSRIYYRYAEGDSYEESFGDKELEGEVLVRRDVTIAGGKLMRVGATGATYARTRDGHWRTLAVRTAKLAGGQGLAVLPENAGQPRARGTLGSGEGEDGIGRRDRFLPDIAALLDPKQFEAISRPAAGVVVIQGGAGSGKTTIGLHRIAYLAYQAPKRFTGDKVLVVVPSKALASYTSRVLPALEVPNVPVVTMAEWQRDMRIRALPRLPSRVSEETPSSVGKVKRHPALLALIDARVDALAAELDAQLGKALATAPREVSEPIALAWKTLAKSALLGRVAGVRKWLAGTLGLPGIQPPREGAQRVAIDVALSRMQRRAKDVLSIWSDALTDRAALTGLLEQPPVHGLAPLTRAEIEETLRWCARRCEAILALTAGEREEARVEAERDAGDGEEREGERLASEATRQEIEGEVVDAERVTRRPKRSSDDEHRAAYKDDDGDDDDDHDKARFAPVDGGDLEDDETRTPLLDAEDDALLLRLHQRMRGPLRGRGKSLVSYEHVFVDEVQDCSAVDLGVLVECTAVVNGERSMTLAGDVAQRLTLDTGLGEFAPALERLGLPHVEVEPLQIGYRSTRQVLALAREVLGPLAPKVPPVATRDGAPIEKHWFPDPGSAAAFLASTLRDLAMREPMASIALVSRWAWQADQYYEVLSKSEIPNLRRVREQDFAFRPGVDLTDVKQVKGLEWDYVVLLDVNQQSYPNEDEARHLLHIAATRAAHQLWLVATGDPTPLLGGWDE